jgi:DNA-binding transcriptional LysR family regulator
VSVTKAAQELNLSQPVVSQHLKALQGQYGSFFKKNGRGLELTRNGEAFYRDIQAILGQIDVLDAKYTVKAESEGSKPLRIGGSFGPATSVLPSLLVRFKRNHPSIEIDFMVRNSPDMQDLLAQSQLDVAVITNYVPAASLEMEPFKTFRLCFFVASDHPLAGTKQVSAEALARYPLICGRGNKTHGRTNELLGSMGSERLNLNVLMRCEWPDAVKTAVAHSDAVGVLYLDLVEQGVKAGLFKIINVAGINLSVLSYIVYAKGKPLSQNAREFLGFLRASGQESALTKGQLPGTISVVKVDGS